MNQTAQQAAEQYVKDCDPAEILSLEEGKIVTDAFVSGWKEGQPQWIPVTERLPEEGQAVIFIVVATEHNEFYNGKVLGGWYTGRDFVTPGSGWVVSHWCSIPYSLLNFNP